MSLCYAERSGLEGHYSGCSRTINRQQLAESDPANAAWQRDLWVSHWRVAKVLEQLESPEAIISWRYAHDILAGMVSAGLFVSAQDLGFLKQLRIKIGA